MPAVSRAEFAAYMAWVAQRLGSVRFNSPVTNVDFRKDLFELTISGRPGPVRARNLCIGTGLEPRIPQACRGLTGARCFHCIEIMERAPRVTGERVVVVGGGQSGAEVVLGLMDGLWGEPRRIDWLTRRPNLEPLDETPFTNQYFTPDYVQAFQTLAPERREELVRYQKLASDGISPRTLHSLYQRLYEYPFTHPGAEVPAIAPGRSLYALTDSRPMTLLTRNQLDGQFEEWAADRIILCTGFEHRLPDCLTPLAGRLELDREGRPQPCPDFNLRWDGPAGRAIYAVNLGRHSHGIAESQLSLMSWRSAKIINHLAGESLYPVVQQPTALSWRSEAHQSAVENVNSITTTLS